MKWMKVAACAALLAGLPAAHADGGRQPSSDGKDAGSEDVLAIRLGIGVKGGLGWVTSGGDDAETPFSSSVPKLGNAYGITVSLEPHRRFGLQLEMVSMAKGSGVENTDGTDAGTLDISYLGGALIVDVKILAGGALHPYVLAGPEIGYILETLRVGPTGNSLDLTAGTTSLDVGVIAGAGVAWEIIPRHEITMEARLDIGLRTRDSSEGNDNEVLNRSLLLMVGYRYWVLPGSRAMRDADRDGIPDSRDRCVDAAEDVDGFKDDDGCPEPDNDGDDILDGTDRCPDEAEDKDGFQDEDGCPDPDNDGDGVNDAKDRCPDQAEDRNGVQDDDGCPDQDSDGDGVADVGDACPDKPGWWTDDGCARAYQTIAVEKDRISLQKGKRIEVAPARRSEAPRVARASEAALGKVARALAEHPRIRLRIGAHTDNTAGDDKSLPLSQQQAEAVRDYLVSQGVSAERLEARGYGGSVPIADNGTKAGRAQNRRIELEIIELPAE